MPTQAEHEAKIAHNHDFLVALPPDTPFPDWVITAMFYTALHQVERYVAARAGQHFVEHRTRERFFYHNADLRPIWTDYRELKEASQRARYGPHIPQAAEMLTCQERLRSVEEHIDALLAHA